MKSLTGLIQRLIPIPESDYSEEVRAKGVSADIAALASTRLGRYLGELNLEHTSAILCPFRMEMSSLSSAGHQLGNRENLNASSSSSKFASDVP